MKYFSTPYSKNKIFKNTNSYEKNYLEEVLKFESLYKETSLNLNEYNEKILFNQLKNVFEAIKENDNKTYNTFIEELYSASSKVLSSNLRLFKLKQIKDSLLKACHK
ncbi:hypothetical protein N9P05_03645 [Flavobacteriaceae bacterium]|nr:hypothetical protein [Flavobacteriaceae bacterium]